MSPLTMPRAAIPAPYLGGPADGLLCRETSRAVLWGEVGDGFDPPTWHRYLRVAGDDGVAYVYQGVVRDEPTA